MGATNFTLFRRLTPELRTMQALYRDAVEQAKIEHGTDSYNGTISTTYGVRLHHPMPVTRAEAERIAERDSDRYNKGEACGAIPVLDDSNVASREVQGWITLEGPGQWHDRETDVKAAVLAGNWELRAGESVLDWTIDAESPQWDPATRRLKQPERSIVTTSKVIVQATEGGTETRYFIQGPQVPENAKQWANGHPTQAAARAALKQWLEDGNGVSRPPSPRGENSWPPPYLYEVVPMTRRTTGEAVVQAWVEVVKTRYPVKVTVGTVDRNGKTGGYLFFGTVAM